MSHAQTENPTTTQHSFRPWKERNFLIGAGMTLLAILLYEMSNWVYGSGLGLRLAGIAMAVAAGVALAVWAARRKELPGKRSGAFTLTCAIVALLGGGAAYLIGQAIQAATRVAVVGPMATLTMTLVVFGLVALITGIIKRINA